MLVSDDVQSGELISAFEQWQFLPYTRLYLSRKDCALSTYRSFSYSSRFSDDGRVWLSRMQESSDDAWYSGLRFLPLESRIFGQRMARLEIFFSPHKHAFSSNSIAIGKKLLEHVHTMSKDCGISHISCAAFAGDAATMNVLESVGYRHVDSIVSYHLPISANMHKPCNYIEEASPEDYLELERIAYECFSERSQNINRFNSDPSLDKHLVGLLYSQFVRNACLNDDADLTLTYKENGTVAGFMTFKLSQAHEIEGNIRLGHAILSAIDPRFQGRGIYRKLQIQGGLWLAQRGMTLQEGKTQLSNSRVIHVWQKLGADLSFAYHTLHRSL